MRDDVMYATATLHEGCHFYAKICRKKRAKKR